MWNKLGFVGEMKLLGRWPDTMLRIVRGTDCHVAAFGRLLAMTQKNHIPHQNRCRM